MRRAFRVDELLRLASHMLRHDPEFATLRFQRDRTSVLATPPADRPGTQQPPLERFRPHKAPLAWATPRHNTLVFTMPRRNLLDSVPFPVDTVGSDAGTFENVIQRSLNTRVGQYQAAHGQPAFNGDLR